jgi:hypothetical protein
VFKRRHKILVVLYMGDRTSDAPGFQGGLNEGDFLWIILQVQDMEWGFHWYTTSAFPENDFTLLNFWIKLSFLFDRSGA